MPAISTMSPARAAAMARCDGPCAVAFDRRSPSGRGSPAMMPATIASPSSPRGLSSVTMMRSARRSAIAAICGRLPASRSPPQPNTQTSTPAQCARSAGQRLFERIGRVRVVDHDQRQLGLPADRFMRPLTGSSAPRTARMSSNCMTECAEAGGNGEQVGDVEATEQRRLDRASPHGVRRSKRRPSCMRSMSVARDIGIGAGRCR